MACVLTRATKAGNAEYTSVAKVKRGKSQAIPNWMKYSNNSNKPLDRSSSPALIT